MALGLVFLPWLKIWDGTGWQGLNYFEVVVAVDRYDGEFNDWQQAYHRGLAAVMAMAALLGTTVAVLVAGRRPDPPSELTLLTAVLVIACGTGYFFGSPGLDTPDGVVTGSAPLVVGLGNLALLLAVPQERTKRRKGP